MSASKRLGTDNEDQVVKAMQNAGLSTHKQPGSGVYTAFPSDVVIENDLAEVKVRSAVLNAKGDRIIPFDCDWLEKVESNAHKEGFNHGVVFVKRKFAKERLVVMSENYYAELLRRVRYANPK